MGDEGLLFIIPRPRQNNKREMPEMQGKTPSGKYRNPGEGCHTNRDGRKIVSIRQQTVGEKRRLPSNVSARNDSVLHPRLTSKPVRQAPGRKSAGKMTFSFAFPAFLACFFAWGVV